MANVYGYLQTVSTNNAITHFLIFLNNLAFYCIAVAIIRAIVFLAAQASFNHYNYYQHDLQNPTGTN